VTGSLKARLLALALAATIAVWVATMVFTWIDAREEIDELLDAHLAQAASLLIAQTADEIEEIDTEHAPLLHQDARRVAFQLWENGEHLRLHSANAPQAPLGTSREGFSDRVIDGKAWRVFTAWDGSHENLVHVGERADVRRELAQQLVLGLLRPLLVAMPVLALVLWVAVSRGLRPLATLTREVAKREPDNLAPIETGRAPREVVPLIDQLNRLFGRIVDSLERERRFTADAAHELRTPVAAIKAQAQVAKMAGSEETRNHAIDQVLIGAERAGRLVEQLLTLARLDSTAHSLLQPTDLRKLAVEVVADLAPSALDKRVSLELAEGNASTVLAIPALLEVMLRNLIDNAIRHGPAGSVVVVRVAQHGEGAMLSVTDNGPGILAEQRENVFQRFYRLPEAGEGGSGLGLSIVRQIAEIHGAQVTLGEPPTGTGLEVAVHFPARSARSEV
jgi:two-component system sensor histidine kinase QseC